MWWQWAALVALGALGSVIFLLTSGPRGALSYLAAELLAAAVFTVSIGAVRWAATMSPAASLVVALMTYVTVIALFAALLARLSPSFVDTPAFAAGLIAAVVVWIAEQLWTTRPRKSG